MNKRIIITAFIFSIYFNSYAQNNVKENIVGTSFSIQSKIMNDEREVQIFLPDSYADSDIEYPVLYILDGQRYFFARSEPSKIFCGI